LVELGQYRKVSFHRSNEKFSALKGILFVSTFIKSVGSGFPQWAKALKVGLIGWNDNFLDQFLKGLKVGKTRKRKRENTK